MKKQLLVIIDLSLSHCERRWLVNPDFLEHGFLNVKWAQMGSLVAGASYRLQHS